MHPMKWKTIVQWIVNKYLSLRFSVWRTVLLFVVCHALWGLRTRQPGIRTYAENREDQKILQLRYRPSPRSNINRLGRAFYINPDQLAYMGIPPRNMFFLWRNSANRFVFVTAATSSQFDESIVTIESIQRHFPRHEIYYYDLGLRPKQTKLVRSLCKVHYRQFMFDMYPSHVRQLGNSAWKQLIMAEVMQESNGTFWIDPSLKMITGDLRAVFAVAIRSGGIVHIKGTGQSNYATMESHTTHYLPVDPDKQKMTTQASNSALLVYKTDFLFWNVLIWWSVCALEPACQGHTKQQKCLFRHPARRELTGKYNSRCVTNDQVILNLLESNYFGYQYNLYTYARDDIVEAAHASTHVKPKECKSNIYPTES